MFVRDVVGREATVATVTPGCVLQQNPLRETIRTDMLPGDVPQWKYGPQDDDMSFFPAFSWAQDVVVSFVDAVDRKCPSPRRWRHAKLYQLHFQVLAYIFMLGATT